MSLYNCDGPCQCSQPHASTEFIVITGGPGAGKTAVLEFMRKIFCTHVAILPESASILFRGGFWRLETDNGRRAIQRTIYHVQSEMQNLVANEKRWALGLCDRGTLDGAAYWPGDYEEFCLDRGTTLEREYAKYRAVIHLNTPSKRNGYNLQNPVRIETVEQAIAIDKKIQKVWEKHPHYYRIESTGKFVDKTYQALALVGNFLPTCCAGGFQPAK